MRLDKLLWFLRLVKTRALAQAIAEAGHARLNGRRIERAHAAVAVGDVLVLPLGGTISVIEIVALPARRGPAGEARSCYRRLDGASETAMAAAAPRAAAEAGRELQP